MNKITHPIEPEELMAYLDGELSAQRAAEAAAHLGECAECQEVVAELRIVSHTLKGWEVGCSELQMNQEIASVLVEKQGEPREVAARRGWRAMWSRQPLLAWTGVLAAVVVVMVGTIRFIGGNANQTFSQVGSAMGVALSAPSSEGDRDSLAAPAAGPRSATRRSDKTRMSLSFDGSPTPQEMNQGGGEQAQLSNGPMIIRRVALSLTTKEFDKARAGMENLVKWHRGYVADLKMGGAAGSGRTLTATLRVPADQLDATLVELKTLGRVESESQNGQDVTSQYVDLEARLTNARKTEKRLTDLLSQRTGKLSDVLEVEQEVDRVRGEIEQMEAQRKNMTKQATFAALNVSISEDYKAQLEIVPPSTSTKLANAAVEGYRSMVDGFLSVTLFLLSNGPSLLVWAALLFLPARFAWKTLRRRLAE